MVFTECQLTARHSWVLCRYCLVAVEGEALSPGEGSDCSVQCARSVSRLDFKAKWP